MIAIKRIYDKPDPHDGYRILVDRLWPRGISKEKAKIDLWLKNIAPSNTLRKWFAHDPSKWDEFKKRYSRQLLNNPKQVRFIKEKAMEGNVTFVYSAKNTRYNNAIVLKEFMFARRTPSSLTRRMNARKRIHTAEG